MPRQNLARRLWSASLPAFIAAIAIVALLFYIAAEGERRGCEDTLTLLDDGEQISETCDELDR